MVYVVKLLRAHLRRLKDKNDKNKNDTEHVKDLEEAIEVLSSLITWESVEPTIDVHQALNLCIDKEQRRNQRR